MNTYAAKFASGLVITFKAASKVFAEAHAHKFAVNNGEFLEDVSNGFIFQEAA